jgi:hypothetical protein
MHIYATLLTMFSSQGLTAIVFGAEHYALLLPHFYSPITVPERVPVFTGVSVRAWCERLRCTV